VKFPPSRELAADRAARVDEFVASLTIHSYPERIALSIVFATIDTSMRGRSMSLAYRLEVDAFEQVVKRALVEVISNAP
jgi:S-adenosylmethionine/arginine decarboxylase-like enzyme